MADNLNDLKTKIVKDFEDSMQQSTKEEEAISDHQLNITNKLELS